MGPWSKPLAKLLHFHRKRKGRKGLAWERRCYASSKSARSTYIMTVPCSSPSWYQESGQ